MAIETVPLYAVRGVPDPSMSAASSPVAPDFTADQEAARFEPAKPVEHNLIAVEGWDADQASKNKAVVINPKADADALIGWALGNLKAVNDLLDIITCSNNGLQIEPRELSSAIVQLTRQVEVVMTEAFKKAALIHLKG